MNVCRVERKCYDYEQSILTTVSTKFFIVTIHAITFIITSLRFWDAFIVQATELRIFVTIICKQKMGKAVDD